MICRVCREPMTVDAGVVSDARWLVDQGQPVPVVVKCAHGHSGGLHGVAEPDFPEIPAAWLEGFRRCYPPLDLPTRWA